MPAGEGFAAFAGFSYPNGIGPGVWDIHSPRIPETEEMRRLLEAAARGAAVLLISEDLDELMALADRIAVIHAGRLGAARATPAWTLGTIGLAMAGADGGHADAEVAHAA